MLKTAIQTLPHSMTQPQETLAWEFRESLCFNLGVALFVLTGIWVCLDGEPASDAEYWFRATMFAISIVLALPAWIMGLELTTWWKSLLVVLVIAGTAAGLYEAVREFQIDENVMHPGHIENGKYINDGLGLSCDVLSDCKVKLQPRIVNSIYQGKHRKPVTHLLYGESASVAQFSSNNSGSNQQAGGTFIDLRIEPYLFRPVGGVQTNAHRVEASYAKTPGFKLLNSTHVFSIGDMDFAEFDVLAVDDDVIVRNTFARSGHYLLYFVMSSQQHQDDRPIFEKIIHSVKVTGFQTHFLD